MYVLTGVSIPVLDERVLLAFIEVIRLRQGVRIQEGAPQRKDHSAINMEQKKQERIIKVVKDLSKLPHNKRCADCTEKLPQYVNLTFNTFICTSKYS